MAIGCSSTTAGLAANGNDAHPTTFREDQLRTRAGLIAASALLAILFGNSLFVGPAAAASPDDITGTWTCCGGGGAAPQNFVITSGSGSLAGTGVLPSGGVYASITGSESGGAVTIVTTYNSFAPGYVATFTGTVSADGNSMSGAWVSNSHQSGTWTATRSGQTTPAGGGVSSPTNGGIPSPTDEGLPAWVIAAIVILGLGALAGATVLIRGGIGAGGETGSGPADGGGAFGSGGETGSGPADGGVGGQSGGGPDS